MTGPDLLSPSCPEKGRAVAGACQPGRFRLLVLFRIFVESEPFFFVFY